MRLYAVLDRATEGGPGTARPLRLHRPAGWRPRGGLCHCWSSMAARPSRAYDASISRSARQERVAPTDPDGRNSTHAPPHGGLHVARSASSTRHSRQGVTQSSWRLWFNRHPLNIARPDRILNIQTMLPCSVGWSAAGTLTNVGDPADAAETSSRYGASWFIGLP